MTQTDNRSRWIKQLLALFALGMGYAAIYLIPYVKYVYNDVMMEVLGATNAQLGWLVSMYAAICIIWYIPGGMLADKYSAKKIIILSLGATGLLCFWFVSTLTWRTAVITWFLLSITTASAYWPAVIKAVRLVGTAEEQGKLYGFFEGFCGLGSTLVAFLGLFVFARFNNNVDGFKAVIVSYGVMNILGAVLTYFFYDENIVDADDRVESGGEESKIRLADIGFVLKLPQVWVVSIVIFCSYGLYVGQTFLMPYSTNVLGLAVTFSGFLAIFRTYGLRLVGGPVGGMLADKAGSTSKVLIVLFPIVGVLIASFLFIPANVNLVIGLILVVGFFTAVMKGIFWSTVEEAGIPRRVAGTTVGITTIIGFLPDSVLNPLFGSWIDNYGNDGYTYMFIFLAGMCAVGLIATLGVVYYDKKSKLNPIE